MVRPRVLVLASVAGLAAAVPGADVSSLVQKDARLHAAAADSSCECIGWKDAYTKHGMQCGWGKELDVALITDNIPGPIAAQIPQLSYWCGQFFANLTNENFCMNNMFAASPTQWCYVSPGCPQGARAQAGDLFVKVCSRDDATLGSMKFEELAAYAEKRQLGVPLAAQFAYPTWPEALFAVASFYGVDATAILGPEFKDYLPSVDAVPGLRERLNAQVASGRPVFFNNEGGKPPLAVAEGKKLYIMGPNEGLAWRDTGNPDAWGCLAGCDSA